MGAELIIGTSRGGIVPHVSSAKVVKFDRCESLPKGNETPLYPHSKRRKLSSSIALALITRCAHCSRPWPRSAALSGSAGPAPPKACCPTTPGFLRSMDTSSAPADAGQEQDLSGGGGEQLQRLSWTAQKSAHACAAFLWWRPTSPDRACPPGAAVGDARILCSHGRPTGQKALRSCPKRMY